MELNKFVLVLLILFGVLLLGPIFLKETFVDASDNSGSVVSVSLKDLMTLIGVGVATGNTQPTMTTQQIKQPQFVQNQPAESSSDFASQFYTSLRGELMNDIKQSVRDQLQKQSNKDEGDILTDSCIDSIVNKQGNDWMRYIPGKNPADYIRKDSIPCYKCDLP